MSTQATPEEIATVVAAAQTWPDAYVSRRVVLHLAGEVAALRRQVEELREIELSEECRGLLMANGSDGTILVCGEFTNGREFSQKFRARAPSPDVVTVPREEWEALREIESGIELVGHNMVRTSLGRLYSGKARLARALRSGDAGKEGP